MSRRHPAGQRTHVAVLERPLGPEGDLDGLFAVRGWSAGVVEGYVHDPEADLRLGPPGTASRTVTSGDAVSPWAPMDPSRTVLSDARCSGEPRGIIKPVAVRWLQRQSCTSRATFAVAGVPSSGLETVGKRRIWEECEIGRD